MLSLRKPYALLFSAALLSAPAAVHALSFGIGPIGGVEFANAMVDDHDKTDGRTGLALGARAEFGVTRPYSLLVEPMYVQKGARFDVLGGTAKGDLDYLEIPLLLKAKFGALKAHAYGIVGPSFGVNLNAEGRYDTFATFSGDFKDRAANWVLSGDIGAGAGFQLQRYVYLTGDVRYSYGFTDALDKPVGDIDSWHSSDIRLVAGLLIHLTE